MAWPETDLRPGRVGVTGNRQGGLRYAVNVGLLMHFAFAADQQFQLLRQGVNH
ncbi:hypothetical protein D3C75_537520 [compost metagenome]